MDKQEHWVPLAKVLGEWGLQGQLKCVCFNAASELFSSLSHLYYQSDAADAASQRLKLKSAKPHGKYWLLHFEGLTSPEAAKAYRGGLLALPRRDLPALEEGEFYLVDLEGFEVFSPEKKSLGRVQGFQQVGDSEVMVVGESFKKGVWVPYRKAFVLSKDMELRKIFLSDLAMDFFEL